MRTGKNPYEEAKRKRMMGLSHSQELMEVLEEVRAKGKKHEAKAIEFLAANEIEKARIMGAQGLGWRNCIKKICSKLDITLKPEV